MHNIFAVGQSIEQRGPLTLADNCGAAPEVNSVILSVRTGGANFATPSEEALRLNGTVKSFGQSGWKV